MRSCTSIKDHFSLLMLHGDCGCDWEYGRTLGPLPPDHEPPEEGALRGTPPAPLRGTEPVPQQAGSDPLTGAVVGDDDAVAEGPLPGPSLPLQALALQSYYYVTYLMEGHEVGHLVPYRRVGNGALLHSSMTPARLYVAGDGQLTAELLNVPARSHTKETND